MNISYGESLKFEWDSQKNEINIVKHGFDFADAPRIFRLPMLVTPDERKDYCFVKLEIMSCRAGSLLPTLLKTNFNTQNQT